MMFEVERRRLTDEALTWLGTPHHHRARVKGAWDSPVPGGVDCLMFIGECFWRAGFIDRLPDIEYSHDGHLHRSEDIVSIWMRHYAYEITKEQALPADVVLYRYGRRFSHGAIILFPGWPRIIHAVLASKVEYGRGDQVSSHGHRPSAMSFWRYNGWKE